MTNYNINCDCINILYCSLAICYITGYYILYITFNN